MLAYYILMSELLVSEDSTKHFMGLSESVLKTFSRFWRPFDSDILGIS